MGATDGYEGSIAETVSIPGHQGHRIHTYLARPMGPGPFPGVVLFHHRPGWDEWYRHATRLFAHRGYVAICPDLYCRVEHGEPDDVAARAQAEGGVPDDQVVGDAAGCVSFLRSQPISSGRIGYFGTCSGARHAYLAACQGPKVDAVVDCWGGSIVSDDLTDKQPVAPVDMTADLPCPVLGLFGNDDQNPMPDDVDVLERALQKHGKQYEFYRYDGAGHGFFYHDRPAAYRGEQALDGWGKVWSFLEERLATTP